MGRSMWEQAQAPVGWARVRVNACGVEAGGHSEPPAGQWEAKISCTLKWKVFP